MDTFQYTITRYDDGFDEWQVVEVHDTLRAAMLSLNEYRLNESEYQFRLSTKKVA